MAQPAAADLRAFQRDVQDALGDSGSVMIDVRSPAEFNGEIMAPPGLPETAQRMGHIPGAHSVPWLTAVNEEDGTFKSADELQEIYGGKGASADKDVIAYCRIGERSSHTWFALKELLGLAERAQLRRLVDRVGVDDRRADREVGRRPTPGPSRA